MYLHLNIKYLRSTNNITQTELSEILGTSRRNIANYEQNRANPPYDKLLEMSKMWGVSINKIKYTIKKACSE